MKICIAGEGAFAGKHLDALARIDGVDVVSICGGVLEATEKMAAARSIPHETLDLSVVSWMFHASV